jgi:LemA protein
MMRNFLTVVLAAVFLSGCGYNEFQAKDEAVKAQWGEVVNQYQRRADLIPNLVNTVKGYASHERETLEAVTRARASATSMQVTPEVLNNPGALQKFQQAQGELTNALSRLMVVAEKYPVARQRYIGSVQEFNVLARRFPTNLTAKMFGYDVKPSFTVENEKSISTAPTVDFNKK